MSELQATLDQYRWFHTITLEEGVQTQSTDPRLAPLWDFNRSCMDILDFKDKRVLDVGCRDGLFSFDAEKRGANEILAIDNDLSRGAKEVLVPYFKSKVNFQELNLYDLDPEQHGRFDIILCFGVLYHLRYPFWGLKNLVDCLEDGGGLLLESGMLTDPNLQSQDLLYCPVENSPYEPTSCTFFNAQGLTTTMRSLGCDLLETKTFEKPGKKKRWDQRFLKQCKQKVRTLWGGGRYETKRQCFLFKKTQAILNDAVNHPAKKNLLRRDVTQYWDSLHKRHSGKRESK